jgi:hypothetical protein
MRIRNFIGAGLLSVLLIGARAQPEQRPEQMFVLLPPSEATSLAEKYERKGPDRIDGSWQPNLTQIKALEANLSRISDLRSDDAPSIEKNDKKIDHPDRYFRQYVAVVRAGQRLIYINALCDTHNSPGWRSHLVSDFGGGYCFWQAWYDPATESFSDLTVNGLD